MNLRSRSTFTGERPGVRNEPETRLHGPWLVLARVGSLLLVASTLALFVGSLPAYYTRLQVPCIGAVACSLNGALSAAGIQALQATALTIVVTLLWSAVGLVIFWRRSDDWVALLAALTLVLYNTGQQDTALTALALAHPV